MDKIWDRKFFEVGGHWMKNGRGWKKTNDHAEPTSRTVKKRKDLTVFLLL